MNKTISPLLGIALLILVANIIIERFVTPISDWIAIPLLLVGIILIIADLKRKK